MNQYLVTFLALTTFFSHCLAQPLKDAKLTFDRLGPIHIGMSEEHLEYLGYKLPKQPFRSNECFEFRLNGDESILVMLEDRRVTRLSTNNPSIKTKSGVGVGYSEKQVKRIYGKNLSIEPHKYDEKGHYLIIKSRNGKSALVFETDGIRVTEIYAGLEASAQYVEGCL